MNIIKARTKDGKEIRVNARTRNGINPSRFKRAILAKGHVLTGLRQRRRGYGK